MKSKITSFLLAASLALNLAPVSQAAPVQKRPNILFIIMDDVGIDQMRIFGYGGATPPKTPVLELIAKNGIRFRNVWSMPECSPSRAMFFEGRYPLRTNILTAILSTDLANSQVSPYEATTPKILRTVGYKSALFGKYHLAGPTNNPYGNGTPNANGFDYFDGFLEGAPHPIDTTGGGVTVTSKANPNFWTGPYSCGYIPNANATGGVGADIGACYFADKRGCKVISTANAPTPGRACLEQGGILVPHATSCSATPPAGVDFTRPNGYYVFNLVTNDLQKGTVYKHPLTDPRARQYSPIETTNAASNWIKSLPAGQPWMATASYALIHAPYQQAPQSLTPGEPDLSNLSCTNNIGDTRILSNQMLEALDTEIGRLLVQSGVATRNLDGTLDYDPNASNTMVVVIGDNGTYAPGVKLPFDLQHAKGFVNQTGVWVPLIVSGPLVNTPNREVSSMVNVADLFQLFGEIAGVDVRKAVPPSRILDSVSMLPYLINPAQSSLRTTNFTQTGINLSAGGIRPGPCVIPVPGGNPTCVQIFPQAGLCTQEGGQWYGPTSTSPGYQSCCDLYNAHKIAGLKVLPLAQNAVRNDKFKLIQAINDVCDVDEAPLQFYVIDEKPVNPQIDRPDKNNIITNQGTPTQGMTPEQMTNFASLMNELSTITNSETQCPGDGNVDGKVDKLDIANWSTFKKSGSSWYDFPNPQTGFYDGKTGTDDLNTIQQNLGKTCPAR
jgi:hypothetical protein